MGSADALNGTVVFTDIVGFTLFTAEQGDEHALAMVSTQEKLVREALPERARVVKELGDGLMIWFSDPSRAIGTSVELKLRFEDENAGGAFPLWVRMGAHHGRQLAHKDDLVGNDVNVAARIAAIAAPREVLVSQATLDAAGGAVDGVLFEEIGPAIMKGLPDPIWLLRATPT